MVECRSSVTRNIVFLLKTTAKLNIVVAASCSGVTSDITQGFVKINYEREKDRAQNEDQQKTCGTADG